MIEVHSTADKLAAAVSVRGFGDSVVRSWSHGSEVLYGYPSSEAVGRVEHGATSAVPLRRARPGHPRLGRVFIKRGAASLLPVGIRSFVDFIPSGGVAPIVLKKSALSGSDDRADARLADQASTG